MSQRVGGDGGGENDRLREIEARLTQLETQLQYLASKEDIQSLKTLAADKQADMMKLISDKQSETLKWQIGIVVAVLLACFGLMVRFFPG